MSLGDLIADFLPSLRDDAESLMVDTCRIERAGTGEPTWDEEQGREVQPPPVTVWQGPCQVERPDNVETTTQAGEAQRTVEVVTVKLPVSVTGVDVRDVVVITASGDPALVDRRFVVAADPAKTHAVSRRLRCREVTG